MWRKSDNNGKKETKKLKLEQNNK